ncbi:MAG TPA: transglutaminase-like domain-containing protein, partial [Cyclobacteriaceae bacterium]|nr:transglutaminase-like domain-containing protein [Cyclobacteriaceae bacterium]
GKPFYSWKQNPDKTWQQIPIENTGNELLGVREGEDHFDFIYKGQLPEIKKAARLWLPLAQSDAFQTIEILKENLPGIKSLLHEKEFGNSVILLELSPAESKQDFEIIYRVRRKEKGPYTDNNTNPAQYLDANILMPVGGRFREIVDETITDKNNSTALMRARALYDYIIDNMRYMKYGDYGRGDALYACDSKTGNCTEFHSLFISLARTAGIPARFAIGAAIPSDRDEGGIDGYHCWAEFFAEGQWWPVDISEGNKYTALATYYFGRHPANRIELSRGRDLRITPGPISGPINFLAYPILELDGKPEAVKTSFSFQRLQ